MKRTDIIAHYTRMPHYQAYYWTGLSACTRVAVTGGPWWYRVVPRPDSAVDCESLYEQMKGRIGLQSCWDATRVDQFVAEYHYRSGSRRLKFAIDSHDGRDIISPELLASVDIYFKANKWRNERYPDNVYPLVNGNGFLRQRHLDRLRAMRGTPKNNDLLFISRVWGGVEHNTRLFETLASIPCKKRLVAIFVQGAANSEETREAMIRLESVGVQCTFDLLPIKHLWQEISTSKVVMIRAGKYMCIPWRMIDLLCMGACMVSDADFEPRWPEPLLDGTHYVSGGIARPADTSAAGAAEYEKLIDTIGQLLKDDGRINRLQRNSADYFDRHAAPRKVGEYILSSVADKLS